MAKIISDVSFWQTSANTEFDEERMFVRYRVTDGDLSKSGRWTVSGVDLNQPISGVWDDLISALEAMEGIE